MTLLAALAVLVAASASPSRAASSGTASAVAAPDGLVTHAGRWLVDRAGRVVVIHGVNVPTKELPAHPAALGFADDDAALLAASGFNAVRLTVERYAVEPSPGHFDDAYIAQFADTVAMLNRHGILSLIDFHQDEYGPVFFDNGFPAWMTMTDGLPNLYQVGFPAQYLLNPALNRAYDHFWANDIGPSGRPLQTDDVEILSRVATRLAGLPGHLGYEIINEPWPGTQYPTCFVPVVGCPLMDRGNYGAYNARAITALRAADPTHLIWYEPLVNFNYGIPTTMIPPRDPRLGFAFHDYALCSAADIAMLPVSVASLCTTEEKLVLSNAVAHSDATGNALLETEFGATNDLAKLDNQLSLYDERLMPWMFWSYTAYVVPYTSGGKIQPATAPYVNQPMLTTLARPYPQLVAGTPTSWSFDSATKTFRFQYKTDRADKQGSFSPGAATDIAIPAVQYPSGYAATVAGGTVASAVGAPVLRILASGRGPVSVTVTPSPASTPAAAAKPVVAASDELPRSGGAPWAIPAIAALVLAVSLRRLLRPAR